MRRDGVQIVSPRVRDRRDDGQHRLVGRRDDGGRTPQSGADDRFGSRSDREDELEVRALCIVPLLEHGRWWLTGHRSLLMKKTVTTSSLLVKNAAS